MGLCLSDGIVPDMSTCGHFRVPFADGSIGWHEAGWGPTMRETAHFVKDIVSPKGAVSIVSRDEPGSDRGDGHTRVGAIRVQPAEGEDRIIDVPGEPGHQELRAADQSIRSGKAGDP